MISIGAAGAVVAQNNADSLRVSLHTTAAYVAAGNAIKSCRRSPRSSGKWLSPTRLFHDRDLGSCAKYAHRDGVGLLNRWSSTS
jgi:hypothetical protein